MLVHRRKMPALDSLGQNADLPSGLGLSRRDHQHTILLCAVLTLSALSVSITRSTRVYLFEQTECLSYYRDVGSVQDHGQNAINEDLCKLEAVQYPLSIIVGVDACLAILPGERQLAFHEPKHLAVLMAPSFVSCLVNAFLWDPQGWLMLLVIPIQLCS